MDSWILKTIQQAAMRRLAVSGAIVAFAAYLFISHARDIRNAVHGPFAVTESELSSIGDLDKAPLCFVRVSGTSAVDTDVKLITIRKRNGVEVGRSTSDPFYFLQIGTHWLVVMGRGPRPTTTQGWLENLSGDWSSKFITSVAARSFKGPLYPFYLNVGESRGISPIFFSAILVAVAIIAAWRPFKWLNNPDSHPALRRIRGWGDPASLCGEIESDYNNRTSVRVGSFSFADEYLVQKSFFKFDVHRYRDLLWAYKGMTRQRGAVYYHANLGFDDGLVRISGKQESVDRALRHLAKMAPFAAFGYTKEMASVFTNKRAELRAAIEARRRSAPA